jgi:hypothetical protein
MSRLHKVHNFAGLLPEQLADTRSWRSARQFVRTYRSGDLSQLDDAPQEDGTVIVANPKRTD